MTDRKDRDDLPSKPDASGTSPPRDKPVRDMTGVEETLAMLREHTDYKDIINKYSNEEVDQLIISGFRSRHVNGPFIAEGRLTDDLLKVMKIEPSITRMMILGLVTNILQIKGEWPPRCIVHPHPKQHSKVFNDPIHGHIEMEYPLVKIIDTPEFQRLRHIKQLGCTYNVYPGASHNCFEHSLGVCYVAGEMMRTLQTECCDHFQISCKDVLCVKIAGLCHNLGRGPFANVFDDLCKNELGVSEWNFEKASVVMFDLLMKNNPGLRDTLRRKYEIEDQDIDRIKAMIKGDHDSCTAAKEDQNRFLYYVVVNKETLIDAETMDSIARDSYFVGVPTSSDYKRLVKFLRVNTFREQRVFCFCDKESRDLYEALLSRLNLSQRAYQHKTVRVIEQLLKNSLQLAEPFLQLKVIVQNLIGGDSTKALVAAAEFTNVTDTITERIENPCRCIKKLLEHPHMPVPSECPCIQTLKPVPEGLRETLSHEQVLDDLRKSQELLKKIHKRDLYRLVGAAVDLRPNTCAVTEKEDIKSFLVCYGDISEEDIFIDVVNFQFGTEERKNPVESIRMYSKADKNKLFLIERDMVSSLLPKNFTEFVYRIYFKKWEHRHRVVTTLEQYMTNKKGVLAYAPSAHHMCIISELQSPPATAGASRDET